MRKDKLRLLRNPSNLGGAALLLEADVVDGDHVTSGALIDAQSQASFPLIDGVPSFIAAGLDGSEEVGSQSKTSVTFSSKWTKFRSYGLKESEQEFLLDWYCKKFDLEDVDALIKFYAQFDTILEVGPGSGFNARFVASNTASTICALDISDAAFTTFSNTREFDNCLVVQADLMLAPFADEQFDFVMADGVLHHTPDTRKAVEALYRKVRPGGRFFFYVYKKMGAVRQYADRYVREKFTRMSAEECYKACEPITELGRALSALNATITLEKPIEILGIPAGTHDVQRLFYYNFIKCFWNDAFDYETNNMVNFDWYHPHDAWQHSEAEIAGWLSDLGVADFQFNDANPNGLSVMVCKPTK